MTQSEQIFIAILLANTAVSILYFLFGLIFSRKKKNNKSDRLGYFVRMVCMIICPVIGMVFFLLSFLVQKIFFRAPVDLEDVIFSKDKANSLTKADEDSEKNIVPIAEALAVTDKQNSRRLLLNVIKGDMDKTLSSIAMALDSPDTETSHYAASILSKAFNDFRRNVRLLDAQIKSEAENQGELCIAMIDYLNKMLVQRVLTTVEQEHFVRMMADTGEFLLSLKEIAEREAKELEERAKENPAEAALLPPIKEVPDLLPSHYSAITERLLEVNSNDEADMWSTRAMEAYPQELEAYKCRLQCLYKIGKKQSFLDTINSLKKSGITFDREVMEMIRIFS